MYNLAMMHVSGTGIEPNCQAAVNLLKQVSVKGSIRSSSNRAAIRSPSKDRGVPCCKKGTMPFMTVRHHTRVRYDLWTDGRSVVSGDYTHALVSYLRASQMGLELGQSNAAWMLEHGLGPGHLSQNIHMALGLYKWSAEQENTNSLLAVGDIFYYGRGIEKDWNRSSGVYQLAEKQKSSRAAYNLGFMYQFGTGLPKDHHLAKRSRSHSYCKITLFCFRYYDLAYAHNQDAFYAVKLALAYLKVHSWWDHRRMIFPRLVRSWMDAAFVSKYQNATHVPPGWWSSRQADRLKTPGKESLLEKVMDVIDLDVASDILQDFMDALTSEDLGDLMESLFLAGLIIVFIAVYRRRRRHRNPRRVTSRSHRIERANCCAF